MSWTVPFSADTRPAADLPLWRECFCGIEALLLRASPVYWGLAGERGDGSAVVLIPGFLAMDAYLADMYAWLYRMDYKPYFSRIGLNAECPNLLIQRSLTATIDRARRETGRRVHLIGHSLGGMIAVAAAAQRPADVASVITLGAPFRGKVAHPNVLRAAEYVRKAIQVRHGDDVLPGCYTGRCTCNFVESLTRDMPRGVRMTAVYSRTDGVVDWRYCVTGDPDVDCEAPGTHIGMVFNPSVYAIVARRLSETTALEAETDFNAPGCSPAPTCHSRTGSYSFER